MVALLMLDFRLLFEGPFTWSSSRLIFTYIYLGGSEMAQGAHEYLGFACVGMSFQSAAENGRTRNVLNNLYAREKLGVTGHCKDKQRLQSGFAYLKVLIFLIV